MSSKTAVEIAAFLKYTPLIEKADIIINVLAQMYIIDFRIGLLAILEYILCLFFKPLAVSVNPRSKTMVNDIMEQL